MTLVWYAAYGSNLSRARFDSYLRGGMPSGARHTFPGCRDASEPIEMRPWEIARQLVFGGSSQTWGGGVALIDHDASGTAKARLYLVTLDQFCDVVAQENWIEPGGVSFDAVEPEVDLGAEHVYGSVLSLGSVDDHPVVTFTQHRGAVASAPSAAYLAHIAQGLREAHAMSDDEIVDYLLTARGIDAQTLRAALSGVGA